MKPAASLRSSHRPKATVDDRANDAICSSPVAQMLEAVRRARDETCQRPATDESMTMREEIGLRVGLSGRMVQHYLNVLRGPPEIQRAVTDGRLRLRRASEFCRLEWAERHRVIDELNAGADPVETLESALARPDADRSQAALARKFVAGVGAVKELMRVEKLTLKIEEVDELDLAVGAMIDSTDKILAWISGQRRRLQLLRADILLRLGNLLSSSP